MQRQLGGVLLSPFIRQRLVMLAARDNGAGGRVRGKVVVTIADPRH